MLLMHIGRDFILKLAASVAATLILISLFMTAPAIQAADQQIEEVVVTGSLIKKDSFDSPSPLQVLDEFDLQAEATPALGEIMANQTFNYGSDTFSSHYSVANPEGALTSANLRGLGSRATLTLVDGKRVLASNLNNMIPQSVIQRIDIVKDGASALYGADAVAGVVNIITKKGYEGIEAGYFFTTDGEFDHDEYVANLFVGDSTDNGHYSFGIEYRERTALAQTDRPVYLNKGYSASGTPNPGHFIVPTRDATGALTGESAVTRDPGCGVAISPGGDGFENAGNKYNNISGTQSGTNCRFQFGEFFNFVNPQEVMSSYFNYEYQFSDKLTYDGTLVYSRQKVLSRGSPSNPGGRIGDINDQLGGVSGDHPGNPFQAMTADGAAVYAQDADGDGVPDRDATGAVVLAADPLDSTQGIPFAEDVQIAALRLFGKLGVLPSNLDDTGANLGYGTYDITNYRMVHTLSYQLENGWDVDASYVHQKQNYMNFRKNQSYRAVYMGLQGKLLNPSTGKTGFYNPFSTSALTCEMRVCSEPMGPGTAYDNKLAGDYPNQQWVADAIDLNEIWHYDTTFTSFDIIATGEVFEMPAGTAAMAFGMEYQKTDQQVDRGDDENSCNYWINACAFDYAAEREVISGFFEFALPLLNDSDMGFAEAQVAGRYTQYSSMGSSFDPKVAVLWQPRPWVSLRGSYSTAFAAPTLGELYEPSVSFLQATNDVVFGDTSGTYRTNTSLGNPNLKPETANVFNLGVSFSLLDDKLNFGIDYANYKFEDRVTLMRGPTVVDLDFQNFEAKYPNATDADRIRWVTQEQDMNIRRLNVEPYTILEVLGSYVNAQEMDTTSFDLYSSYDFDLGDLGQLTLGLDATNVTEFTYTLVTGVSGDGVGKQNGPLTDVPPLPEWRVIGSANWSYQDAHNVMLRARWNQEVEGSYTWGFQKESNMIEALTYLDLTYTYRAAGLLGDDSSTTIEVGARNLLDEYPAVIGGLGGIDLFIHDPRGRTLFARLKHSF